MKFTTHDLVRATEQGIITLEQQSALIVAFQDYSQNRASLTLANLFYYLGGLIVIASTSLYVGLGWESLGGAGHLIVSLVYGTAFLGLGHLLWHRWDRRIPGGILVTAAVSMIPLSVYSLHELTGWWAMGIPGEYRDFHIWIRSGWTVMEIATAIGAMIALRFYRFPFLTMPLAFVLWYFSIDLTAVIYGPTFSMEDCARISMAVGLVMLILSYCMDHRTREDFAFWGYLFGVLAFWGGLTFIGSGSELDMFLYFMVNVGLMLIAILLQRRVFLIFGAIGAMSYLGHLTYDTFRNEIAFTFVLSGIGLFILLLGIQYHRHEKQIEAWLLNILPATVRATLPQFRR